MFSSWFIVEIFPPSDSNPGIGLLVMYRRATEAIVLIHVSVFVAQPGWCTSIDPNPDFEIQSQLQHLSALPEFWNYDDRDDNIII